MEHGYGQTSPLFAFTVPTIGKMMPTAANAMNRGIPMITKHRSPKTIPV
jgi:hypothetical protein